MEISLEFPQKLTQNKQTNNHMTQLYHSSHIYSKDSGARRELHVHVYSCCIYNSNEKEPT